MPTPMGEVIILRACSDGFIQLAGPSMTAQLARLKKRMFELGAAKVIIRRCAEPKIACNAGCQ